MDIQNFTTGRDATSKSRPQNLIVEVELPMVKSAADLDLDIFEKQLILDSKKPDYFLDLVLPCKVDENLGKAQFDKGREVLSVTLPIIYSKDQLIEPTVQSSLVTEVQDGLSNHVENGICNSLNGIGSDDTAEDTTVPLAHLKSESIPSHNGTDTCHNNVVVNGQVTNGNSGNTLNKELPASKDDSNFNKIDTSNGSMDSHDTHMKDSTAPDSLSADEDMPLMCDLPEMSQLPPYSWTQTEDTIIFDLKVTGVNIQHVSMAFTDKRVFISFPEDSESSSSLDYSMVVQMDDPSHSLDSELCSIDISESSVKLYLAKKDKVIWDKVRVGCSCNELEDLHLISRQNEVKAPVEKSISCSSVPDSSACSGTDDVDSDLHIDLLDLQDDVIEDGEDVDDEPPSPMHTQSGRRVPKFTRSLSHEPQSSHLKSILKRSTSDVENYDVDTDDDHKVYARSRSLTHSERTRYSSEEWVGGTRRRIKSVTFHDNPLVHEFRNLSKKEYKRKLKVVTQLKPDQDVSMKMLEHVTSYGGDSKSPPTSPGQNSDKGSPTKGKHRRNKKGNQRQRQNSESRSEEETDEKSAEETKTKRERKRRKKQKNKGKNFHMDNSPDHTQSSDGERTCSDSGGTVEVEQKPQSPATSPVKSPSNAKGSPSKQNKAKTKQNQNKPLKNQLIYDIDE